MGQATSACKDLLPDTVDTVQFQIKKHSKILSELNNLTYEQFQECLAELNDLSRKCIDKDGNQLVFAVNKDSYVQWIWKATIKISCVSINPDSRKISQIKIMNLKQFLHVFNTMVVNIEAITASEERQKSASSSPIYPTTLLNQLDNDPKFNFDSATDDDCIICMERKPEVILSCLHTFCTLCIEQWNETGKKSCPICSQELKDTKDSWVPLEIPEPDEINEEIVKQLQKLTH
ncbi:CLUMA_CG004255, isoform A [Clunio marinus]|uniref:RING finger protein 141 n=1 Tax=Clunio marinus TaxID=568069 RepID=A0A1J1HR80_9DIPT|nr:CLUMA_CG004255, isoform A [Clunio marinus]